MAINKRTAKAIVAIAKDNRRERDEYDELIAICKAVAALNDSGLDVHAKSAIARARKMAKYLRRVDL